MLVAAGALSGSTLQSTTTALAGFFPFVFWTVGARAVTRFLGITRALRRATDSGGGRELAVLAAVLVRIVTDGVVLKLARRCVRAAVLSTLRSAAAVAILAFLDDAVAADGVADGGDTAVVGQAGGSNTVALQGGADITDRARGELRNTLRGRGIHDVLFASVAGAAAQRTALLGVDGGGVGAGGGSAVVDGAVGVACLVGDDLPFGGSTNDDVGAGDGLAAAAGVLLRALHAGLA